MDMKKILKITGVVILVAVVLFVGLGLILNSLGGGEDNGIGETGGRVMYQAAAPSAMPGGVFKGEAARDMAAPEISAAAGNSAGTAISIADKKIIKTGDLSLKVENADKAAQAIAAIAKANQGEVSSSNFYESSGGVKSGYLTVRVPYNNFDAAFSAIKQTATQVVSESSNAQDITEQYIDLSARLKNKQAEEVSFTALLNRSGDLEQIIAVTRELARVRGEIEQLDGQIRYLNSQTDMSTITANISEDVIVASVSRDWRPWQVVKQSAKQLLSNGQGFVDGLIAFIIVVLPTLAIYALVIWLIYYLGKKAYRRWFKR